MTIDQLLDEMEALPDFEGDLMAYFCISRSELDRLAERADTAEDISYIMAGEDWWRDQTVAVMQVQSSGTRSLHA